ncbi:hypothetical protein [Photobacterium sanguinicancri]|uniref:hypothetical protein n=1 Tax=Photobacterium sanguinicancri TaxID=875932 RepID=UPI003D11C3F7
MSALSDLYQVVRQRCPGVIDFMMLDALVDAYREFCHQSEFLIESQDLVHPAVNKPLPITATKEHTILKIESVKTKDSRGREKELYQDSDYDFDGGSITFNKPHDNARVSVVVKPSRVFDYLRVNDYLVENFGEAIAAGAASRLRLQVNEKWFNPDLSAMYQRDFIEGYRDAYRLRREQFNTFHNKTRKRQFY